MRDPDFSILLFVSGSWRPIHTSRAGYSRYSVLSSRKVAPLAVSIMIHNSGIIWTSDTSRRYGVCYCFRTGMPLLLSSFQVQLRTRVMLPRKPFPWHGAVRLEHFFWRWGTTQREYSASQLLVIVLHSSIVVSYPGRWLTKALPTASSHKNQNSQ